MLPKKRQLVTVVLAFAISLSTNTTAPAQAQADQKKMRFRAPDPERVLIETKDRVELQAEWFAGVEGKETVPVILIHDWDGKRQDLFPLAQILQKKGHAVVVPDLRGHGQSLNVKGVEEELDRSRFKKAELASMIEDIDSCRRFLQEKNDEGKVNLDMLVVIGCGKMAAHAMNWCIVDWRWGPIGGVKQGRNVKSLVLISPRKQFKSLRMSQGLKSPLMANETAALPTLVIWGKEHQASARDGESIYNSLRKARGELEEYSDIDQQWANQSLFPAIYKSDKDGVELLNSMLPRISADILLFIERKVVDNSDKFLWQKRKLE